LSEGNEEQPSSVFIDIALGKVKHRITLRADSDPAELAAEFTKMHNLDTKL
jgi:hypothetical protein